MNASNRPTLLSRCFALGGLVLGAALAFGTGLAGCKTQEEGAEQLCNPGDNIFCRCEDNSAGTKKCSEDGMGTGECGNCQAAPVDPGPTQPAQEDGTPHVQGQNLLLMACTLNEECASGKCFSGYCTQACTTVSDCEYPDSECVPAGEDETVCMPRCRDAQDCAPFGASSQCGFAHAADSWRVSVCANWGGQHKLMPVDTSCPPFDHKACNLGYAGRQTVCSAEGRCVTGCFYDSDCLGASTCSAQGSLGSCQ